MTLTKTQTKTLNQRIAALQAELRSDLTKRCGKAAEKCIREDIATARKQLRG